MRSVYECGDVCLKVIGQGKVLTGVLSLEEAVEGGDYMAGDLDAHMSVTWPREGTTAERGWHIRDQPTADSAPAIAGLLVVAAHAQCSDLPSIPTTPYFRNNPNSHAGSLAPTPSGSPPAGSPASCTGQLRCIGTVCP